MRTVPYIRSLNKVKITFLDIQPSMIKIDAILLHLAKTCRYHAMIDGWYSNAEHSMQCSWKAETYTLQRACLIHDFGEHITQDVAGPVKVCCPDYERLCVNVQGVMNKHFIGCIELPWEVKLIDKRITATEQRVLRDAPDEDLAAEPYDDVKFQRFEWRKAYLNIKARFQYLFPEYQDAV